MLNGGGKEIVGIGFKFPWAIDMVWIQLDNAAGGDDKFLITADSLYKALKDLKAGLGIVKTGDVEYAALWHSHPRSVGPSSLDIREFPEHLVNVGYVYHTPTGTTSRYNSSGEIS